MANQGVFISFEGIDGAGKTTQVQRLADRLRTDLHGLNILSTREPGSGVLGKELRRLILHPPVGSQIDEKTELLILLADRAHHVATEIRPHLQRGGVVICDRYSDSSIAYQGFGRGIPITEVRRLNVFATDGLWPDMTILLDIDPQVSLGRNNEKTRMEAEIASFHRRVRDGFMQLAMEKPERFIIVDATQSEDAVHEEIWKRASRRIAQIEAGIATQREAA